jgi:hypothetical protein
VALSARMNTFLGEHETRCVALLDGIGGTEGKPCDLLSDTLGFMIVG